VEGFFGNTVMKIGFLRRRECFEYLLFDEDSVP
jgi:hypothetical protein